jgi:transposase, IS30 family
VIRCQDQPYLILQSDQQLARLRLIACHGSRIYFCDPHSPWQRGSNENANGLLREYLPKGTDLSQVSQQQLTAIEHSLNNRPRKILNFHSPAEVFDQLTSDLIRGVALQV